jgi:pyruvate,water dikinase
MNYIKWFSEITTEEIPLVGGKGANLGEMVSAGFPVPPGFCLTAPAYRAFIDATEIGNDIKDILANTNLDYPLDVEDKSRYIRKLIYRQSIPRDMEQEILDTYFQLSGELENVRIKQVPVAVRSSATAEDLPTASFAGTMDTYLNVRGESALLDHIKRCWASLWTARAVIYREKQGFDHHRVYLAVVVQSMIPSETSGILFTVNPINGNRDETVINASWGLGEAIVSGMVTPDTITVNKINQNIVSKEIADKQLKISYAQDGGVVESEIAPEHRSKPTLTDAQILDLTELGKEIEGYYASPQDIEWAYAGGKFYLLQARPITTLTEETQTTGSEHEYNRSMFVEILPDPLSPIFAPVVARLFHSMLEFTFKSLGFTTPQDMEGVGIYYNQVYFNKNYIEASLETLSPSVRDPMVANIVNPFGHHGGGSNFDFSRAYIGMVIRLLRFMNNFPKQLPKLLDQYHQDVEKLGRIDIQSQSSEQIVGHLEGFIYGPARELLDNNFLLIAVTKRAYQTLGVLLKPYFHDETDEVRGKLISGNTGNVTMETNIHLWDLARVAKSSAVVSHLIREYSGEELFTRLGKSTEGQSFLNELSIFLSEFGHREVRMDIIYPTWVEDNTPVISFIRGYLDVDDSQDPSIHQEQLIIQRKRLISEVRNKITESARGRYLIWPIFNWLLDKTEILTRERDTLHFELTRAFPLYRKILSKLGDRLEESKLISNSGDIYYLTLDEIGEIVRDPEPVYELIKTRREEFEINKSRSWPVIIRGKEEIFLEGSEPGQSTESGLAGISGSPGTVTGVARVINGPEEFGKLQKGEILVAPITNPVWTPLFAIASGIVTEVGGILSHGAIVAREYGIPAVMSIPSATKLLTDGETIIVDGNKGFVYLAQGVD